jgi:iron complex outermembrane receptor protein
MNKNLIVSLLLVDLPLAALAQNTPPSAPVAELDPVVVSAERSRQSTFDAPAAISAVTRDVIDSGGLQVNLSEALNRVPGITVLNRQNYAQDLQLSIRGFGARSTFGIRGVRLIVDGIPATMPDGQGQASNIALGSAQRIEVLRGPLAQLYGNAAGGVVQVFTGTDVQVPTLTLSAGIGSFDQVRLGSRFETATANDVVIVDASSYHTDGYRENSDARRDQLNAKWERTVSADTRISLVANVLDQPFARDPAGLTRTEWESDPKLASGNAKLQKAGKIVAQQQLGGVIEQRLGPQTTATARLYFGARDLENALSTPFGAQQAVTSAGGIVKFNRGYWGTGLQLAHTMPLGEGRSLRLTGGVELDRMNEDRTGYINNAGVQGALKRDERNTVENNDVFVQGSFDIARTVTATAGVRASKVKFRSDDHFIVAPNGSNGNGNPDDSGGVDYSATNPVIGLTWRATPTLNLYANVGRGFETPTLTELSYRAVGTGLNTDLLASRSRHAELGAKWKIADGHRLDAALFDIATRDEIVTDTNLGGRTTYKNAGRTTRKGVELQYLGQLDEAWRTTLMLTSLRARFDEAFVSGSGASAVTVPAGNRLPATPERSAFAELAWAPKAAWGGFNAGLEVVHTGALYVNDANTDAAPAATIVNLRAGLAQKSGAWTFRQLLRLENAADKRYAGSVIVNEANQRYFEPALPRNWMLSLSAQVAL